ncbi:MAG: flagellar export chaperone FlgN [Anaerovoracaceae bacterium]|mgnify:CR=1 FL=1|jgi:flagellar biosynthesis/type III secretory pathway chaperone
MTETRTDVKKEILDSLYEYLCGILKLYEDILPVLKEELDAICRDDISSLDENLKTQQALLFKTKNFDRDIAGYISRLNIEATNLSSLIRQIPEEHQLRFYALLGRFAEVVQDVDFYRDKCQTMLQTKLYSIDKALSERTGRKETKTYDRDASEIHNQFPKSFETTI